MNKIIFLLLLTITFFSKNKKVEKQITEDKIQKIEIQKINASQLPKSIKYEGILKNAVRWKDKLGENIVITTETGEFRSKKIKHEFEDSSDAELFGYHFLINNDQVVQNWKVYDFINDCPFDISASFVKNTFNITDLNKNGIAEIWLMYKTICRSDVSPATMKIIMYEGQQKFAMRGENQVQAGIDEKGKTNFMGGNYKFDIAFQKAPKAFKDYAINLWNKNKIEKWDN